jgi:hypothetical protein
MKNLSKTLHFNEKEINLVFADGQWWVAVKPVCTALGVDYIEQFKNLKSDPQLLKLLCEHTTTGADNKQYKMLCLPEKFIYGWLFSIRSGSESLNAYKMECYEVLWNHFHGRLYALVNRMRLDDDIAALEAELARNEKYQELQNLIKARNKIPSQLRRHDADLLSGQIKMDFQTTTAA